MMNNSDRDYLSNLEFKFIKEYIRPKNDRYITKDDITTFNAEIINNYAKVFKFNDNFKDIIRPKEFREICEDFNEEETLSNSGYEVRVFYDERRNIFYNIKGQFNITTEQINVKQIPSFFKFNKYVKDYKKTNTLAMYCWEYKDDITGYKGTTMVERDLPNRAIKMVRRELTGFDRVDISFVTILTSDSYEWINDENIEEFYIDWDIATEHLASGKDLGLDFDFIIDSICGYDY